MELQQLGTRDGERGSIRPPFEKSVRGFRGKLKTKRVCTHMRGFVCARACLLCPTMFYSTLKKKIKSQGGVLSKARRCPLKVARVY